MKPRVTLLLGLILFLVSSHPLLGAQTTFRFSFGPEELFFDKVRGFDRVTLESASLNRGLPGDPLLPLKIVHVAIPTELEVEKVELISTQSKKIDGVYNLYPAQKPVPASSIGARDAQIEFVPPNPATYALSQEFPGKLVEVTKNGFLAGHHLAGLIVYPLQYVPSEGRLVLYTDIEFRLVFKPSSRQPVPVSARTEKAEKFFSDIVKGMVINPADVVADRGKYMPWEEQVDFLIITDDDYVSTFQELADWKIQRGFSTKIRDISWVESHYWGEDLQDRIRECIKDYYQNHGTIWVLLGGDVNVIPERQAKGAGGGMVACDLYYSDLDGTWDWDGDDIYGEIEDSVDMYPDVFVGRAPADTVSKAEIFVDKCLIYEKNPPTDYLTRLMFSVDLLYGPATDHAELKDYIDTAFVYPGLQITKLYESSENLDFEAFRDSLNAGQNIINHVSHGQFGSIEVGPPGDFFLMDDMDELTNGNEFGLFYTWACLTAAIGIDCLAEHWVNNPDGGGFAYIGNSSLGWAVVGDPLDGASPQMDLEFFRFLYDSSAYQLGKAFAQSKVPFIPIADSTYEGFSYRHVIYCLILLGDPTIEIWTDSPGDLNVSHSSFCIIGDTSFTVSVTQDGALACLSQDGQVLGTALSSGGQAVVYLNYPINSFEDVFVTVTGHDYLPYQDTIEVRSTRYPYVVYHSHQINDSLGNDDGVVNPGETILVPMMVKNIGLRTALSVIGTLRENDDNVVLTDSVKSYGTIAADDTAQSLGQYAYEVDFWCPDSYTVEFELITTSGTFEWRSRFYQEVIPHFIRGDVNNDGTINAADILYLTYYLFQQGDPPPILQAADCTCDQIVDAADLVFLNNYLYHSGPPPYCP